MRGAALEDQVEHSRDPFAEGSAAPDRQDGPRTTLQDALRALASGGASGAAGGLSAARIAELARHAGLTGAPQASELARLLGQSSGGMSVDDVPEGPRYVVFVVGGVECAMPAACVQGIDRLVDVTPVPHTAAWVLGVMQFRGTIVSVVDLAEFLQVPTAARGVPSRLLIVSQGGMSIAFVVDAVLEMRAESSGMREDHSVSPPHWLSRYAAGVLESGDRKVVRIDAHELLFAEPIHQYQSET